MKKLYIGIIFGVFALASFMALNLYTSTSFPGYGTNAPCNECHNQPALVKNVDASFAMNNHAAQMNVFTEANGQWATDEVPTIPTNNRSDSNLEFISLTFLKNSTDIMVRAQVSDSTYNASSSTTSDKFGLIFDIDVANFTVGDFLTNYNATATNLDNVLTGQMAFSSGHADFWYVDLAKNPVNQSSMAMDDYISGGINSDGASHQDVHVAVWFGGYGHGKALEYDYIFVRSLSTNDPNDAQFNVDGTAIRYAVAHWDASSSTYHYSSFDQAIVVGDNLNVIQTTSVVQTSTVTVTKSATTTSGTTSSFTIVFGLAALVVCIPFISHM